MKTPDKNNQKSQYYFAVITEVPKGTRGNYACDEIYIDPKADSHVAGANIIVSPIRSIDNYEDLFGLALHPDRRNDTIIDLTKEQIVICNSPVFKLGEILIMDKANDRTIPDGRKPGKWCVSYECFNDLIKAINCSRKVVDGGNSSIGERRSAE